MPTSENTPIISPRLVIIGMTTLLGSSPRLNDSKAIRVVRIIITTVVMKQTWKLKTSIALRLRTGTFKTVNAAKTRKPIKIDEALPSMNIARMFFRNKRDHLKASISPRCKAELSLAPKMLPTIPASATTRGINETNAGVKVKDSAFMWRIDPETIPKAADIKRIGTPSRIILLGFSPNLMRLLFDLFLVNNSRMQKRMNRMTKMVSIKIKHKLKKAVTNRAARSIVSIVTMSPIVARLGATTLSGSIPCLKETNVVITVKDDKKMAAIRVDDSEIITSWTKGGENH